MFDFPSIWQSLIDVITLQFLSPFWWWTFNAVWVTALALVIGWAFPPLRSFAGAVILAVIAGLSGYRRAEYDVDRKAKERKQREAEQQQRQSQQGQPNGWPWKW